MYMQSKRHRFGLQDQDQSAFSMSHLPKVLNELLSRHHIFNSIDDDVLVIWVELGEVVVDLIHFVDKIHEFFIAQRDTAFFLGDHLPITNGEVPTNASGDVDNTIGRRVGVEA